MAKQTRKVSKVQEPVVTQVEFSRREKILRYAQKINADLVAHRHTHPLANVCEYVMGRQR